MEHSIKSPRRFTLSYIAIFVLVIGVLGTYFWQHGQVNKLSKQTTSLQGQVTNLTASSSALKSQSLTLSAQLNKANQAITNLSQSNAFISGAVCQTQQLALSEEGHAQGAAGSTGQTFSYQNTSATSCTVNGYPGFLALDSTGHVMPNGPVQTGGNAPNTPKVITLAPSAKAYFLAFWPHWTGGGVETGCITPSLVESTPPGNLLPLTIATSDLGYMCPTPSVSALSSQNNF